jgi:hypothetical protein
MLKLLPRFSSAPLLTLLTVSGCGDDGTEPSVLGDLTAVWRLSTTVTADGCGSAAGATSSDNIILIQCGNEVSVISGPGLWGSAAVVSESLAFTGTEVQTDEVGCRSTHRSTGTLTGTSGQLAGAFKTNVTYDPGTCGVQPACTVETSVLLRSPTPYRSSCIDRDQFGNPAASEYVLPYSVGEAYVISNSYCIPTGGHREQQAYDFLIPIGDPVVAARGGVVRTVKDDSPDNGLGSDHNHIMIEHLDGTVGFYAHLQQGSSLVAVGNMVEAGQLIANSGHSGTTDVPHLHFGVYSGYPPSEGSDRAVNFQNATGPLDCRGGLVNGAKYTAQD